MKTRYILILFVVSILAAAGFGQFPQMQKTRDRLTASEDASNGKTAGPEPYRAKMNVDVQLIFATKDVKTFAEAKPVAVTKVVDGDPLWMYLKFNGPLGKYVYKLADENGNPRNLLAVEIATPGEFLAKSHYILSFADADLNLTETKIALTTGLPGRNKSLAIFLKSVASAKPASTPNEVRVINMFAFPRGPNDNLAKVILTTDLAKGVTRYPPMLNDFRSGVLRGTNDITKLPVTGKFDDIGIRTRLTSELKDSGTEPDKLWFTADDWVEFSEDPMNVFGQRTISAAFTYAREGKCYYGVAEITQPFDPMTNRYGASVFKIDRDLTTPCVAAQ